MLADAQRHTWQVLEVRQKCTCRVQEVGGIARMDLIAKGCVALEGAVGEWMACRRFCRFALSVVELVMRSVASWTGPICLVQMYGVQRGSCMLMSTTAMADADSVSKAYSLLVAIIHTCAYDVRCPSRCKRATSWICRDKSSPDGPCCAYSSSHVPRSPPVLRSCSSSSETPACRTLLRCVSRRLTSLCASLAASEWLSRFRASSAGLSP